MQEALQLLAVPDLADLSLLDAEGFGYLAETYADTGRTDKTDARLARMEPSATVFQRTKFRVIAAMVSRDYDHARDLLQDASMDDSKWCLLFAIDAAMTLGQNNMGRFLAMLPPRLRLQGLHAVGYHQAEIGDAEGALATQARLLQSGYSKPGTDLRPRIAPILAATGHPVEAVQMAHELQLAPVTALVAAHIE